MMVLLKVILTEFPWTQPHGTRLISIVTC